MAEANEKRVLRVGVVHDGHLIQERRFRKAEDIVVGKSRKCTLNLPGELVPDSYRLFAYENGEYFLRFAPGMTGT
ncbi:MAG: hypothetical protein FJ087_19640, partial [Deltaproteobacteria bacterium]|nr:hypothetical protein [Deltaproteobacteria bacterium]